MRAFPKLFVVMPQNICCKFVFYFKGLWLRFEELAVVLGVEDEGSGFLLNVRTYLLKEKANGRAKEGRKLRAEEIRIHILKCCLRN